MIHHPATVQIEAAPLKTLAGGARVSRATINHIRRENNARSGDHRAGQEVPASIVRGLWFHGGQRFTLPSQQAPAKNGRHGIARDSPTQGQLTDTPMAFALRLPSDDELD